MKYQERLPLAPLLVTLLLLLFNLSASADSPVAPASADFQVNSYTTHNQSNAAVSALPDGGFMIVWESDGDRDGDRLSIHGRRFDSAGQPVADEFQVNSSTFANQQNADVQTAPDGSTLVAFDSRGGQILGQRYDGASAELGSELEFQNLINTEQYRTPSIAFIDDGSFLLSYSQIRDADLYTARFASDGTAIGGRRRIKNRANSLELGESSLVARDDQTYVVTWEDTSTGNGDADGYGVRLQALDSNGANSGSELVVNAYTTGNQRSPRLVEHEDEFLVVWQDDAQDPTGTGVYFQRYDSSLSPLGGETRLLSATDGDYRAPDATIDDEGTTLVVYESPSGILGSSLDSSGNVLSPSGFIIAEISSPDQFEPRVAALANGFVVVWTEDYARDGGGRGLFARLFRTDQDGDSIIDDEDNCPIDANLEQDDGDVDGSGDVCDNCNDLFNPDQSDIDADAIGDQCDNCPATANMSQDDVDFDTFGDACDNCPEDANLDQADQDSDGVGDLCDNCPFTANSDQADVDGDGLGDVCDISVIGDRVWLDANLNGLQDGGEAGFPGVDVELFDSSGVSHGSTTTAADGSYSFVGAPPGVYYLAFSEPPGFCYSSRDQGFDDQVDSDVDPGTLTTLLFPLEFRETNTSFDAGLVPDASIGNRVWLDDGDGIQAGGEPGVGGVTVNLYDASGGLIEGTVTDSAGTYAFAPGPGEYYLEFIAPAGFEFAPRDQGSDDDLDSDVFPASGTTAIFELGPGAVDTSRDAGLLQNQDVTFLDGPEPFGEIDDFQINTTTTGTQEHPDVVRLAGGSYVVTWDSARSAGDDPDASIQLQRYDSDGAALGAETQVNTVTTDIQARPEIAAMPDGGFWIVWQSDASAGDDASLSSIQMRRFDSSGAPLGDDSQVNQLTAGFQESPSIAVADDGSALIAWSAELDGSGRSVQARAFDDAGSPAGDEIVVSSYTTLDQILGEVEALENGEFLVVWSSDTDSDGVQTFGRRIDITGTPVGDDFQLSKQGGLYPAVATTDGGFLTLWTDLDSGQIVARFFDNTGQTLSSELVLGDGTGAAKVARVSESRFLVTWADDGDGDSLGVRGRLVELDGVRGDLFFLNSFAPGDQDEARVVSETGAAAPSGRLFATWQSSASPGNDFQASVLGRLLQLPAEIGDRVFLDGDFDGAQDGGEAGIENVTVGLYSVDDQLLAQTATDVDGRYSFYPAHFPAGDIEAFLRFEAPSGVSFTVKDGTDDALDSDADPATGETDIFQVSLGHIEPRLDAGLAAGIGDRVWFDADGNGVQDGGEEGVRGVTVSLRDGDGAELDQTMTNAEGAYAFAGLDTGPYYLEFIPPAGFEFSPRDQGADDADSDVNAAGRTSIFLYFEGSIIADLDAGLMAVASASIGNRVWLDDGDGIQDGGEPGVEAVTVNLYDASNALLDTTTTNASGGSSLLAAPGDYYLEFILPAGMAFAPRDQGDDSVDSDVDRDLGTTSIFTLGPGQVDASRDAGLEPAVIGNRVWDDQNADGRQQPSEPGQAGITVRLLDESDQEIATTTTDMDGVYRFLGVATGTYRIEVVLPAEGVFSPQDVGADDLIDSDIDPSTGRSELFEYVAATASRSWDAGLRILHIFEDGFESGDLSAWSETVP